MDDLVQFLRDRLDEDARDAEAAGDSWYGYEPEQQIAFVSVADARHIARHDPARVLREVEAKRQLLRIHRRYVDEPDQACLGCAGGIVWETSCPVVRLLALPYADHPDYREDWRP
ncbi:DUF6221 family protein [Streptomyces sp. NBC_00842]|uniref:DUF6221 family protein n=1 Tax=Streptomyces sp. NBC_00842 TaxID=2975848 RepID=UPI0038680B25|nr:DUF6221 family protein [Streptomyces sp. NBC_00842]